MRTLALSLTLASLAFLPLTASAESPWTVKVGVSQINPKSNNGMLAGNTFFSRSEFRSRFYPCY
jgi:outer membrane protein